MADLRIPERLVFTDLKLTTAVGQFMVDPTTGLPHFYVGGADRVGEHLGNKGAASGYAGLDSSGYVPTTQLGSGSASSSKFLRGDQTWSTLGSWGSSSFTGTAYAMPYFDSGGGTAELAAPTDHDLYTIRMTTTGPTMVREGAPHPTISTWAGVTYHNATRTVFAQPTLNSVGALSDGTDSSNNMTRFQTATPLGSGGGDRQANGLLRLDHDPVFETRIKTGSSVADVRYWVLISLLDASNSDTGPNNSVGLNYSAPAGDTTWWAFARDGSSQSRTNTGVAMTADTVYTLMIRMTGNGTSLEVTVNGTVTTHTTNLPAASTQSGWLVRIYTNLGGTLKTFYMMWARHEEQ